MKKILFIIIFLFVIVGITYNFLSKKTNNIPRVEIIQEKFEVDPQFVFKSIDLSEAKDTYAQRILYEYIMDDFQDIIKSDEKIRAIFNELGKDVIRAISVDLNNDGENEIIGFVNHGLFSGTQG